MENLQYYYNCMVSAARQRGFAAFAWDNNAFGNGTEKFGIFRRSGGNMSVGNNYSLKGICGGAGVEFKEPETPSGGGGSAEGTLFWEGNDLMDWSGGLQLTIPAFEFETQGKDVQLILQYTLDYSDYDMIQLFYGDWKENPSFIINGTTYEKEYTPDNVHGMGNGESCTSVLTFDESTYNSIIQKGIVIQGHGVRLNKVLLGNGTTGIQSINVQPSKTNNPYYYLMDGRRTTSPTHGLYIHNGQKIMIGK